MNTKQTFALLAVAAATSACGQKSDLPAAPVQKTVSQPTTQEIKPEVQLSPGSEYNATHNARVFEYTPKGDPSKLCVITITPGLAAAQTCFPKKDSPAP
jgi:hypothetical protein